jgi:membrane protease YdiL (CAAX protease family)
MPTVLIAVLAVFVFASLAGWWIAIRRWQVGEEVIPREQVSLVRWGLVDFLFALSLYFVASAVISPLAVNYFFDVPRAVVFEDQTSTNRALLLSGTACGSVLAVLISIALIRFLHNCTWRDLGWVASKIWSDVKLGIVAFVMLAPPVYGLQVLLTQFVESKHPLIESMREQADMPLIVASGIVAVLVAPVVEEYLLRVLLQGWLEKLAVFRGDPLPLLVGEGRRLECDSIVSAESSTETPAVDVEGQQAMWPVLVSSMVFALMHFSHGPDWIPLFVLALGLGYLYRQTHRIVPCIVVHFLLNACSFGIFVSGLQS